MKTKMVNLQNNRYSVLELESLAVGIFKSKSEHDHLDYIVVVEDRQTYSKPGYSTVRKVTPWWGMEVSEAE